MLHNIKEWLNILVGKLKLQRVLVSTFPNKAMMVEKKVMHVINKQIWKEKERSCESNFPNSCAALQSYQVCRRIHFSSHSCWHLSFVYLIIVIITGVRLYFIGSLIFFTLSWSDDSFSFLSAMTANHAMSSVTEIHIKVFIHF